MPEKKDSEKENSEKIDFIKWFSEINKDSGNVAGGKGANLAEIYNLKIAVPPGFVVTAQAYDFFIKESGMGEKIKEILDKIHYEDTKQLDESTKKIRELIEGAEFPKEMAEEITESYEHLGAADLDLAEGSALDILRNSAEPIFVAVRSSATTEDLAEASFAGQQDTYLNIKGPDSLLKHVRKCFASLFTSRATYYRNKQGFKHEQASLAVVVQKMVDADKSGVIFSKDPAYNKEGIIMEAVWGLGEGIVSGKITPDKYVTSEDLKILDKKIADKKIAITRDSAGGKTVTKLREDKSKHQVLTDYEIKKLSEIAMKLETHYKKPQDIEFAIENEGIYIVQTRPITTLGKRVDEEDIKEIKGEAILEGLAASPGIAVGKIKIIDNLEDLHRINQGDILVTKMTNPDMVVSMQKSSAIITDDGGLTAHAAIVSREMGIPCIVGTHDATTKLKEGETITVDGYHGKIYKGKVAESEKKIIEKVNVETKTQIKVMVDLPSFAERASKTGLKKVGLTRMEGIIAESGKHPNYFLEKGKIQDYEEVIFSGVSGIAEFFDEIWVRTSDIRSDEFANLKGAPKVKEANPMLGFHGIRYSLKNPEILKAELNALRRVAEKETKIGLLLPQVILVEEVREVKKILKEINFTNARVGVMVETPAAVQLIKDFCEEGIDFISFGTNDLTQYLLAVDRGNEKVQHLYNEMHPAVLYQLAFVIRVCKRYKVETSICGQAGSKKEMAKFLVENGIDSISVNADVAKDIAEYVKEIEEGLVKGTDKEPRQYEVKKQEEQKEEEIENVEEIENKVEREDEKMENNEELENRSAEGRRTISQDEISEAKNEKPSEVESLGGEIPKPEEKIDEPVAKGLDKERVEKDVEAIEEEKKEYEESEKGKEAPEQEVPKEENASEEVKAPHGVPPTAEGGKENKEIDSTERELPKDITKEELEKDQHRDISEEDKKDSEKYLEEAKKEGVVEETPAPEKNVEKDIEAIEKEKKEYEGGEKGGKDLDIY